jgi:hypothetical protein
MKINYHGDWIEISTNKNSTEYFSSKLEIIHGVLFIHNSLDLSAESVNNFITKYLTTDEIIDLQMGV